MSDYKHRMSLAVPQALMAKANQLALIVGESSDDDKTFTTANWQDANGNLYAVCSTVIKPVVLSLLGQDVSDSILKAEGADTAMAQQAMNVLDMYVEGAKASPDKISIAIDVEPMVFFDYIGLTAVVDMPSDDKNL